MKLSNALNSYCFKYNRLENPMVSCTVKPNHIAQSGETQLRRWHRSCQIDHRFYSDSPQIKVIARGLADKISADRKRALTDSGYPKMVRFISCLLVNFFQLSVIDPGRLLGISLRKGSYTKDSEFTYRTVSGAMRGLVALGYVSVRSKGFWDARRRTGATTRFEATPDLGEILSTLDLSVIRIKERAPLVELRRSKQEWNQLMKPYREVRRLNERLRKRGKKTLDLPKLPSRTLPWPAKFRRLKNRRVANLRTINKALLHQFQGLHVSDEALWTALRKYQKPVNLFKRAMHRVFTTDPQNGGRFVGAWWHTLSTDEKNGALRKHIYMSAPGEAPGATVELDYEALHLRMLYAASGIPCTTDPYLIYDEPAKSAATRKAVKLTCLMMVNAISPLDAKRALQKKINREIFPAWWEKNHPNEPKPAFAKGHKADDKIALMWPGCPPVDTLMANIEAKHFAIADRFYTGAGRWLMFEDSELCERILLRMIDEYGVVPLPMHDSYIVRHDFTEALEALMQEMFLERFGVEIPIEKKSPAKESSILDDSSLYSRMLAAWQTNPKSMLDTRDRREGYQAPAGKTLLNEGAL